MGDVVLWSVAMQLAATGPSGFYRRGEHAAAHFRTSVTAAPAVMAAAIATVLDDVDEALGRPALIDVVDIGAGGGELLAALAGMLPDRVRLAGVDVVPRPAGLPSRIAWQTTLPGEVVGLVIAHEYLDDLPVDVAEVDETGAARLVLVDMDTGEESLGEVITASDHFWVERWWPIGDEVGSRAEIGRHRDSAWKTIVESLQAGVAIAIDYDHVRSARPTYGTLTGYRSGRAVRPVPNGTCNLTAHVALDSCAPAGQTHGAGPSVLLRQHEALSALAIGSQRPPIELARSDPAGYLRALAAAGAVAEVLDPGGLGGFGWLLQAIRLDLPHRLAAPT